MGMLFKVKDMQAGGSGGELENTVGCMDLKNSPAVPAVICNVMLLAKQVEREHICDAILVDIDFIGAKVCNLAHGHYAAVAVNSDWVGCWADVVNMVGVGKKVNGALTVEKEVVWVDGTAAILLGKDDDAGCIACDGRIIDLSIDGMNLLEGRLLLRAHSRRVPKFVAPAASNVRRQLFVHSLGRLGRGGTVCGCRGRFA
jgi:hypothetical protein